MSLIEIDDCVFDEELYQKAHGFDKLDSVAKEAFVNHVHSGGENRYQQAEHQIEKWQKAMLKDFSKHQFRIYIHDDKSHDELTIRFHVVRHALSNWVESESPGLRIITVGK